MSAQRWGGYTLSVVIAFTAGVWLLGRFGARSSVEWLTDHDDKIDMQPSVSPDGKTVAFIRFRQLMLMELRNRTVKALPTPDLTSIAHPSWSPDGKRLAFSAVHIRPAHPQSGGVHVVVMDLTTKRWECLTPTRDFNTHPTWSPDGKKLTFTKSTHGTALVCVYDFERKKLKELGKRWGRSPAWSPDGKTIAFISGERGPDLWLMNADGTNPRPLFVDEETDEDMPYWSPDGKFIVFTRQTALVKHPDRRDLWAVRVTDKKAFRLTECPSEWWAMAPCVQPDGKGIIFALRRKDHSILCRLWVDWGNLTPQKIR